MDTSGRGAPVASSKVCAQVGRDQGGKNKWPCLSSGILLHKDWMKNLTIMLLLTIIKALLLCSQHLASKPDIWVGDEDCLWWEASWFIESKFSINIALNMSKNTNFRSALGWIFNKYCFEYVKKHKFQNCFRLNVFTRDLVVAKRRPVVVWIHGGSFSRFSYFSLSF